MSSFSFHIEPLDRVKLQKSNHWFIGEWRRLFWNLTAKPVKSGHLKVSKGWVYFQLIDQNHWDRNHCHWFLWDFFSITNSNHWFLQEKKGNVLNFLLVILYEMLSAESAKFTHCISTIYLKLCSVRYPLVYFLHTCWICVDVFRILQ